MDATTSKNWGHKKTKNHARVIFHVKSWTLPLGSSLWISAWGVVSPIKNYPCQILCQSVEGFRSSEIPNVVSMRFSWSPLKQCKLHYRATPWSHLCTSYCT